MKLYETYKFCEMCWSSIISINVCTYIHASVYGSQVFMYSKLFATAFMSASVVKICKKNQVWIFQNRMGSSSTAAYLSYIDVNIAISHQLDSPFFMVSPRLTCSSIGVWMRLSQTFPFQIRLAESKDAHILDQFWITPTQICADLAIAWAAF